MRHLTTVSRIVAIQCLIALAAACLTAPFGLRHAGSALLAGGVLVIPNALLARCLAGERRPARVVLLGYGRLLISMALLGVTVALAKPAPAAFFGTLLAAQMAYVLGSRPIFGR